MIKTNRFYLLNCNWFFHTLIYINRCVTFSLSNQQNYYEVNKNEFIHTAWQRTYTLFYII